MAFWSDVKLEENLIDVIRPFDRSKVDVSGYRLSVGSKAYITKDSDGDDPTSVNVDVNGAIQIPPGQFALISTKEKVTVPIDAIGFISIRATIKFKGLINVSGFHVDPGYSDHLIFSVFNAGPSSIIIQEGDEIFLIWFASLDQKNRKSKGGGKLNGNIPSTFIGEINKQVNSTAALSEKFKNYELAFNSLNKRLDSILDLPEKIKELERKHTTVQDQVKSTVELNDKVNLFESQYQRAVKWALPAAVIFSGVFAGVATTLYSMGTWTLSNIETLKVQSQVLERNYSDQKSDINDSIAELEKEYKSLRLAIDNVKSEGLQRQAIDSINARLANLEQHISKVKQIKPTN
jgi:dCTP deaminase